MLRSLRGRMVARLAPWLLPVALFAAAAPAAAQGPKVRTLSALSSASLLSPGAVDVRLVGRIDNAGTATRYYFEYGPTEAYGSRTAEGTTAAKTGEQEASGLVGSFAYGQMFHYRVVAVTEAGSVPGGDMTYQISHRPLRPPGRVVFASLPTSKGLRVTEVRFLDLVAGSNVDVSHCTSTCNFVRDAFNVRRRTLTLRINRLIRYRDDAIFVTIFHAKVGLFISILDQRSRGAPQRIREMCDGIFDYLVNRVGSSCPSVAFQARENRLRGIAIGNVFNGVRIEVACRGPGCPRPTRVQTVTRASTSRPFESVSLREYRALRSGARLDVYLTRPGSIGISRRIEVTKRAVVAHDYRCIAPGTNRRSVPCA